MKPRIAIPLPHSSNREYSEKVLPQYEQAVEQAGGEPLRILLDRPRREWADFIALCQGVLLPGSRADVDPRNYCEPCHPLTNESDPLREAADWALLQHAYATHTPVLGICYGLQSLNVFRGGSLHQHLDSPLAGINHGDRESPHVVRLQAQSFLAQLLREAGAVAESSEAVELQVNSSHHQAAATVGKGLRVSAEAPGGIVEALEGASPEHFVLAVQWHPERSLHDPASQAIFRALIQAGKDLRRRQAQSVEPHRK